MDFNVADSTLLENGAVWTRINAWLILGNIQRCFSRSIVTTLKSNQDFHIFISSNTIINWVYKVLNAFWLLFWHESHVTCTKRKSQIPTNKMDLQFFVVFLFWSKVNKHLNWKSKSTWFHFFSLSLENCRIFFTFLVFFPKWQILYTWILLLIMVAIPNGLPLI